MGTLFAFAAQTFGLGVTGSEHPFGVCFERTERGGERRDLLFLLLVATLLFAFRRCPRSPRRSESLEEFAEPKHDVKTLLPVRS